MRADTPVSSIRPVIDAYEAGKVLYLKNLDLGWTTPSGLPADRQLQGLEEAHLDPGRGQRPARPVARPAPGRRQGAAGAGAEAEARDRRFYKKALPIYEALFKGYRFTRRHVVWRLNTIRNENLHVDTYQTEYPEHFARMFINLDDQPRIWMTSYAVDEMFDKFGGRIAPEVISGGTSAEIHAALNAETFGGRSNIWWDGQPRHVAMFAPGDVWIVDSRQIAHQIFYGRRAVSIDFVVDPASMHDPSRHYYAAAEAFRARALAARTAAE